VAATELKSLKRIEPARTNALTESCMDH